jgi:hypothetical protein
LHEPTYPYGNLLDQGQIVLGKNVVHAIKAENTQFLFLIVWMNDGMKGGTIGECNAPGLVEFDEVWIFGCIHINPAFPFLIHTSCYTPIDISGRRIVLANIPAVPVTACLDAIPNSV